ncbi:TonB-dependent receptor domain-containing protein [Leptolyngbya sp. NK1-12]|uniref:TonB-dependent siderophore receptor n=1 Tax=Leptolyngbya sp. NK1-12 TaxID=2547451 RepID=UPI00292D0062
MCVGSFTDFSEVDDFTEVENFSIAPVVSVAIGERTRFTLEGEYTYNDQVVSWGLPPVGSVLPNPNGEIPRDRFIGEPDSVFNITQGRVGYRLEHQFSDNWSIQNALQWKTFTTSTPENYFLPGGLRDDNRTLDGDFQAERGDTDIYDLNLNLTGRFSTGLIRHQLTFGVDLGRYDENLNILFAPATPLDVFNPIYGQPATEPYVPDFVANNLTDTLGIYIQNQVILAENLKLLLGGRFDLFEQTNPDLLADTQTNHQGMLLVRVSALFISPFNPFPSMPATVARLLQ